MPQVVKLPLAETDLDDIWWYIARTIQTPDLFLDKIEERCQALAQFPKMGISRDELLPSLRSLPIGKYLIFYMPIDDGIQVARVLPAMRDIDALF